MKTITCFLLTVLTIPLLTILACNKSPQTDITEPPRIDSVPGETGTTQPGQDTTAIPDFDVTNTWQCEVDGVLYSGTIDTSYITVIDTFLQKKGDTVITVSGTAYNKKANILLTIYTKGVQGANPLVTYCLFDTASVTVLRAGNSGALPDISCNLEKFRYNKAKGRFSGVVSGGSPTLQHSVANGMFSCQFLQGNSEPKKFSWDMHMRPVRGYFNSAVIVSHTLVLDGQAYNSTLTYEKIQLHVRTGEEVKPGVYKSTKGDVGLYYFLPSMNQQYVDDSTGDLTVTIQSVDKGIVTGVFSGTSKAGDAISEGTFSCRIKNYRFVSDAPDRWVLNTKYNYEAYRIYSGNVLKARQEQQNGRYVLIIDGNSDFGASVFKIQMSSSSPVSTGTYSYPFSYIPLPQAVDSFYFRSNEQIINGGDVNIPELDVRKPTITITAIDANGLSGTITGAEPSAPEPGLRTGHFTAKF